MSVLRCYLHNMTVDKVKDVRCDNNKKCTGCIFVESNDGDIEHEQVAKKGDCYDGTFEVVSQ